MTLPRGAEEIFFEALITGDVSGAIMNQEKRGQAALVNSDVLPIKCNNCTRKQFETVGVVYGEIVDDLFVRVTLPAGWKKVATDHDMHSNLVDDQGRIRAIIFYKAAFYDRSAHIYLCRRYSHGSRPVTGWGEGYKWDETEFEGAVLDQDKVVWRTATQSANKDWDGQKALEGEAKAYIEAHYPDYQNPLAYWDAAPGDAARDAGRDGSADRSAETA